jgi:hypothetical protein
MKARSLVAARRVGSKHPLNWVTTSAAISNRSKIGAGVFTILVNRSGVKLGNRPKSAKVQAYSGQSTKGSSVVILLFS